MMGEGFRNALMSDKMRWSDLGGGGMGPEGRAEPLFRVPEGTYSHVDVQGDWESGDRTETKTVDSIHWTWRAGVT